MNTALPALSLAPVADAPMAAAAPPLSVTYLRLDSDTGWAIEVARAGQLTDGTVPPNPNDVPADIREYLIEWLKQGRS